MNPIEPLTESEEYGFANKAGFTHVFHKDKCIASCCANDEIKIYETGVLITRPISTHDLTDKQMYGYAFFNKKDKEILGIKDYEFIRHKGFSMTLHNTITVCEEGLFIKNETLLTQEGGSSSKMSDYYVANNYKGKQVFERVSESEITPQMIDEKFQLPESQLPDDQLPDSQ